MKKITIINFIFIFIYFLNISTSYDYLENNSFNSTQLPLNGTYNYYFNAVPNMTLYFNQFENDQVLNLDFENNYTFSENEIEMYNFTVKWELDSVIDETRLVKSSINITNSRNKNVKTIGFEFNIKKLEQPLITISGSEIIEVINGTHVKTITVDKLPNSDYYTFNFGGTPNSNFNLINCSEFLECPDNILNFNSEGRKIIDIPYLIPVNTVVGDYNSSFYLVSGNLSKKIDVKFKIRYPNFFIKDLNFTLDEACYDEYLSFKTQSMCEELKEKQLQDYRREIFLGYNNYIAKVNPDVICNQTIKTEYIIGDSIQKETLEKNIELSDKITVLNSEIKKLQDENIVIKNSISNKDLIFNDFKNEKNKEINELKELELQKKLEFTIANEKEKEEYKSGAIFWFKFIVFCIWFSVLILISYDFYINFKYANSIGISKNILYIILSFFVLLWITLMVVL